MTPKPTPTAMRLPLACFTSVVRSSTAAKSAFFQRRSVFLTLAKRPFFFGSASGASSVSAGVSLSDCSSGFAPFSASVEGARSSTDEASGSAEISLSGPSPPFKALSAWAPISVFSSDFCTASARPPAGGTEGTLFVSSEGRFLFLFFRIHLFSCFMSLS